MREYDAEERAAVHPAYPPAEDDDQRRRSRHVDERRGERDPPDAEPVEGGVERRVQAEVAERDRRRDPRRLEAEEGAVQHQHRPVERQAERERGQGAGDDRRLIGREGAALVDEAHDGYGEHRARPRSRG